MSDLWKRLTGPSIVTPYFAMILALFGGISFLDARRDIVKVFNSPFTNESMLKFVYIFLVMFLIILFYILSRRLIRRLSATVFILSVIGMVLLPFFGSKTFVGDILCFESYGVTINPSDFLMPSAIVVFATLLSGLTHHDRAIQIGGAYAAIMILFLSTALLMLNGELAAAFVLCIVFAAMAFLIDQATFKFIFILPPAFLLAGLYVSGMMPVAQVGFAENQDLYSAIHNSLERGGIWGSGAAEDLFLNVTIPSDGTAAVARIAQDYGFAGIALISIVAMVFLFRTLYISTYAADNFSAIALSGLVIFVCTDVFVGLAMITFLVPIYYHSIPFNPLSISSTISDIITFGFIYRFALAR